MKKCKKIVVLVLTFLLLMTLNVYADNSSETKPEVTLTPNKTSVKVGETVTIALSASYENGIECVDSILEYDTDKLNLENVEMKNHFTDQSGTDAVTGDYILTALYGEAGAPEEAPVEVEYAELTFKVLDTAQEGEQLSVKLLEIDIIDPNLDTASAGEEEVTLTVIEEQKQEEPQEPTTPEPEEPQEPITPEPEEPKKEEQKPTEEKDNTTADKEINYAGVETYAIILIIAVVAISVIFYIKYKKYSDIY